MVADQITKEQAAMFIKKTRSEHEEGVTRVQMDAVTGILQILFNSIEDMDFSDVHLEDGEADDILEHPLY